MPLHVVSDEELATWRPRLEKIAQAFRSRAEVDDLVQEGWIFVWRSLQKGVHPTDDMIRKTMRMWCRTLRRQEDGRNARLPVEVG